MELREQHRRVLPVGILLGVMSYPSLRLIQTHLSYINATVDPVSLASAHVDSVPTAHKGSPPTTACIIYKSSEPEVTHKGTVLPKDTRVDTHTLTCNSAKENPFTYSSIVFSPCDLDVSLFQKSLQLPSSQVTTV